MRMAETAQNRPSPGLSLFLIGALVLFLELACIRWFVAYVVFLQFFTNIVLIACFLGVSVGCLCARQSSDWLRRFARIMFWSVTAAVGMAMLYRYWSGMTIDVGGQDAPEVIFFGTEYRSVDLAQFVIPMEVLAGFFFTLITLIFIGLGQFMGQCFDRHPNRIAAYTLNIGGSLAGIVAFGLLSLAHTPPVVWFAIGFMGVAWLLKKEGKLRVDQGFFLVATLVVLFIADFPFHKSTVLRWSPYYQITHNQETRTISANTIGHQQMVSHREPGPAYSLIHLLQRDAGGAPFKNVLIIGAGSGNDVSHALLHGVEHIDAVEIDPVILALGQTHHPDRPYDDARVTPYLNDGRNFLRKTSEPYNLVVYALVDSLILHSTYSSIRLESFLFTREAFQDVRAALAPDGVFVMYNYFRQGWVVHRLAAMLEDVFGEPPLIFTLPYTSTIDAHAPQSAMLTMLVVGNTTPLRQQFSAHRGFHVARTIADSMDVNGFTFRPRTKTETGLMVAPARLTPDDISVTRATDDWPFLYLRTPTLPGLYLRAMGLIAGLSLILLWWFSPGHRLRFQGRMFFLGAGFLLLETKAVVHLALVFGSTWLVNSLVFFSILVMILGSNLYVLKARRIRLPFHYAALFICLGLNCLIPLHVFLAGNLLIRYVAPCLLTLSPVFFAGVVFAQTFRNSSRPDRDIGSNIAGAVLGGLAEYTSTVLGFRYLLVIAIGFYALSSLFKKQR